ncbi:MAG TPA: S8 family serine peptidase, partial [Thermoanaerobaculia bacterium]|nr:S8 family serine peptidase [Thermoanaerobaculia bacterium]
MRLRPVIAVLALAFAMSTTAAPKIEKPKQRWQPAHVVVKYKAGFAPAAEKHGLKSAKKVFGKFKLKGKAKQYADRRGLDRVYLLELKKDNVEEAVAALNADPSVEYAEPNWVLSLPAVPNDPSFGVQWGLQKIGAPSAWDTTTNGAGVVVGVVDSGIELTHPDLVANLWTNPGEVAGNGIDDDGNGFVDDIHGWNFADDLADPTDLAGHGTRVAGVIAATGNNATQVTGVAWTAKLAALKIGDSLIYVEAAVQAVEYANMMGFRITTNSWGWNEGGQSFLLDDVVAAAEAAGHLFIAGAGNDGHDNDQIPCYPSHYTNPNVISVTATDESDALAWFSNYGFSSVDLAAPGTNIDTTSLGGTHVTASGTSFATPFVAGAAALYWTANPSLTPAQVRDALMLRSDPLPSLHGRTVSGGRLNIANLFDSDAVAPNAIGDLTGVNTSHRSVTIRFTATGDDGAAGRAARYDVRVSAAPITAANFDSATPLIREPQPQTPGTLELFKLSGLAPSSTYYIAVRALDNAGNASALSNVASFTTQRMAILFDDNVEAGSRWTVTGSDGIGGPALWRIASGPMSDSAAWNYNRDLDSGTSYDTGAPNWGALTSRNLDLTQARDTRLRFRQHVWTDRHLGEDLAQVQVSANGGAWTTLLAKQTTLYDMIGEELDLSAYDGQHIRIRFFIDTVDARRNSLPGWVLDDIVVDATSANAAASATIDALPSIVEDQPATLTATASDPEGAALEYKWSFGDGRFAYTTTPSVTHTWRREGSYNVTLVVYDGSTSSDTASVTAVPVPVNDRPVAALKMSAPPPYLENALIYLNDFHSTDEEGAPLIFHFDYGDGSTYTTSPGMVVPHTWTTPGTYTITMTADDGAQLSLPVTLTIDIVEASNDKPVARISTSSSGVHPNENVTFDGSASTDEETAVVSYQWTFPDGSTASGPTVSKSFNSGAQNVTLTVMDQTGIASTAATTEVRVCGGADAHLFARTRFTCPGGTAALGIQVRSGFLPMTLTWSDGFVQQLTSTTNGLGERLVTPSADTTYSLVSMTDFLGCAGTVNTTPLQVQLASATLAASTIKNCPGQPTQLNPQLKGDGPWTLTWSDGYVQQIPLQGDARRIVTPAATTTYSIASATCASCPTGTTAVVSGSVTVETMEPLSATVTGGGISCNGSGAPVTVTISGGEPPFLVYWTNMGAMSTSSRTVTAYFSPSTVTTYTP